MFTLCLLAFFPFHVVLQHNAINKRGKRIYFASVPFTLCLFLLYYFVTLTVNNIKEFKDTLGLPLMQEDIGL